MGELRNNILVLERVVVTIDKKCSSCARSAELISNNGSYAFDIAIGGLESLSLYLTEKMDIDDSITGKTKLKDAIDSDIKLFVKGINDGRSRAIKFISDWNDFKDSGFDGLKQQVKTVKESIAEIEKTLARKKKKLLQSKKYKAKMAIYTKALESIKNKIDEIVEQMNKFRPLEVTMRGANSIEVTKDMDYESVIALGGMNLSTLKKNVEKEIELGVYAPKEWRKQHFGSELKSIKNWVKEADEIDQDTL